MKLINSNLAILSPIPMFPESYGGSLRTYNLARISSDFVGSCSIFSQTTQALGYEGIRKERNINIIQNKIPESTKFKKYWYHFRTIFNGAFEENIWDINLLRKHDIYQLESPFFYDIMKKIKKNYILDEHNIWWELEEQTKNNTHLRFRKYIRKLNKKKELNVIKNALHVFVTSEIDKQKILNEMNNIADNIAVIPNCVDLSKYKRSLNDMEIEKISPRILFIGYLFYFPNADAVNLICNKIAPKMLGQVDFIIVGKGNLQLKNIPKNVTFTGYIDNIIPYISNSDICIAPLRYGSGTRLKILEYLAMKKPVICTSKAAEGLDYSNGKHLIIENDIDKYPEIIKNLINNEQLKMELSANGIKLIKDKYDWNLYSNRIKRVYEDILGNL